MCADTVCEHIQTNIRNFTKPVLWTFGRLDRRRFGGVNQKPSFGGEEQPENRHPAARPTGERHPAAPPQISRSLPAGRQGTHTLLTIQEKSCLVSQTQKLFSQNRAWWIRNRIKNRKTDNSTPDPVDNFKTQALTSFTYLRKYGSKPGQSAHLHICAGVVSMQIQRQSMVENVKMRVLTLLFLAFLG